MQVMATAPPLLTKEADGDFHSHRRLMMKDMVKSFGDRELAWIMLAIASVLLWSTWGLVS